MDYSKIPDISLQGLSKKDFKLVKENPDMSLAQLAELGLTEKGEKILADISSNIVKPDAKRLIPKVTRLVQPKVTKSGGPNGMDAVKYRNNRTGQVVTMAAKAARALMKNKPHKGQIVK
jgi:hypothetical protein